ncbi:hypothetical protein SAMN05421640_2581 [Ekhidna lutea]|uniref:MetA-pathway of phenol degradation n=1 Tax=Ekhidna lutea TaxID=447679 RepID=A0A239KEQ6_EKHLU|nr:hypothetical protein [Ekhidna lutea]SNT16113.1 hypothetical protein SAMN05421640_2581 [Ekhidna lutea]
MEILNNYKKLSLAILLTIPFLASAGGGWTKQKGTAYYKVSQWWVVAAKHYTGTGGIDPNVTTGTFNTSFYGEYGITDRLTGIVYFPFFSRTFRNEQVSGTNGMVTSPGEAVNSIGDTDIAVKYGLSKPGSKFVFAGTLLLGLPLGKNDGGSDGSLQTGDGEFNQMVRFDLSRSFSIGKINAYGNIYTAFNNRTNNFSDEFRAGGEVGASFLKNKLWGIVRVDMVESLQNGLSSAEGSSGATIFANNTEFISYTYEAAYYATDKLGFSASYGGAFSAKLIFASPSYSVGVFLDLK